MEPSAPPPETAVTPSPSSAPEDAPAPPSPRADRRAVDGFFREVDALSPRPPGSPALAKLKSLLKRRLTGFGYRVTEEPFPASTPRGVAAMSNVVAEKPGAPERVIYLAGHIDTKEGIGAGFTGANDSGSSTAALLEIARVVATEKTTATIRFLFLDGEESTGPAITPVDGLYGSRFHASRLAVSGKASTVRAFILLDMVGDTDLALTRDLNSSPELVDLFARCARETGNEGLLGDHVNTLIDDHVPFAELGIPVIDLIDFEYGPGNVFWHTPDDHAGRVSTENMARVADCVLCMVGYLDREKGR
ncbi:MAG: M28 family peptidase [Acidobacteria bacterium]|nr:M28 family peptidase [Acidobacteriota bacterium]